MLSYKSGPWSRLTATDHHPQEVDMYTHKIQRSYLRTEQGEAGASGSDGTPRQVFSSPDPDQEILDRAGIEAATVRTEGPPFPGCPLARWLMMLSR